MATEENTFAPSYPDEDTLVGRGTLTLPPVPAPLRFSTLRNAPRSS